MAEVNTKNACLDLIAEGDVNTANVSELDILQMVEKCDDEYNVSVANAIFNSLKESLNKNPNDAYKLFSDKAYNPYGHKTQSETVEDKMFIHQNFEHQHVDYRSIALQKQVKAAAVKAVVDQSLILSRREELKKKEDNGAITKEEKFELMTLYAFPYALPEHADARKLHMLQLTGKPMSNEEQLKLQHYFKNELENNKQVRMNIAVVDQSLILSRRVELQKKEDNGAITKKEKFELMTLYAFPENVDARKLYMRQLTGKPMSAEEQLKLRHYFSTELENKK